MAFSRSGGMLEQPSLANVSSAETSPSELSALEADRRAAEALQASPAAEKPAGFLAETGAVPGSAEAAAGDPLLAEVERILEKNLGEIVEKRLSPERREAFTAAGRELAGKILELHAREQADAAHGAIVRWLLRHLPFRPALTHEHLVGLVGRWLKRLPETNRFFLEQDAKIVADEILAYFAELSPSA